jgi:hypothetical protein
MEQGSGIHITDEIHILVIQLQILDLPPHNCSSVSMAIFQVVIFLN